MIRNRKVLEWVLSVSIPISIIAGLYLQIDPDQYWKTVSPEKKAEIGDVVALPGINWEANRLTLVLVMQVGCYWCEASAPFFQTMAKQESAGHKFHIVAVLPQPTGKSLEFMRTLGLSLGDIRQAKLNSLGVSGTPTLLLVDHTGRIKSLWVGKLPPESETRVLKLLGVDNTDRDSSGN